MWFHLLYILYIKKIKVGNWEIKNILFFSLFPTSTKNFPLELFSDWREQWRQTMTELAPVEENSLWSHKIQKNFPAVLNWAFLHFLKTSQFSEVLVWYFQCIVYVSVCCDRHFNYPHSKLLSSYCIIMKSYQVPPSSFKFTWNSLENNSIWTNWINSNSPLRTWTNNRRKTSPQHSMLTKTFKTKILEVPENYIKSF